MPAAQAASRVARAACSLTGANSPAMGAAPNIIWVTRRPLWPSATCVGCATCAERVARTVTVSQ